MTGKLSVMKKGITKVDDRPWTKDPYKKQNWGNGFHSIAPYIGRIKPAFAHWLIRILTKTNDIVLDPFCGIGTIPLEADLLGRNTIAFDLSDYAITITKSKFDRRSLKNNQQWLDRVKLEKGTDRNLSEYIKQFYHYKTLNEIISLKEKIIQDKRYFLLGCLIGIIHGHRPQYLSAWTGYIIPFKPTTKPEYKEVIPRLKMKIERMHKDGITKANDSIIKKRDAMKTGLEDNSVDAVITSPPYYDTIDYVSSNRLRLEFLGISNSNATELKQKLIQKNDSYLEKMEQVGSEMHRVLKPNSPCVFVLGDVHKPKKTINTAKEISELFSSIGFETKKIIQDEIPLARRTANKWKGDELKKTKSKLDRILIMKVKK